MALLCGVDVGARSIRAIVVRTGLKKAFTVEQAIEQPLTQDPSGATPREEVVAALSGVMARLPQGLDSVVAAMPGDQVVTRVVDLPDAAARRIDQVLPFELEGNIALEIGECVVDHQPVGTPDRATHKLRVLAAVVPRSRVSERLALYAEGGLDPRELAESALVLAELAPHLAQPPDATATAVVDLGHDRTDVAIFRGTTVEACRTLSRAGRHMTAALQRELQLSAARAEEAKATVGLERRPDLGPEHAMTVQRIGTCLRTAVDPLVRDLRQTLGAYRATAGVPVGQIVLAGAGARLRGLAAHLSSELGVPTSMFAFPAVAGAPASEEDGPIYAKALALALRGGSRTKRIDFRRGGFAPKSDTKSARGVMIGSVAWVAVLAFAWGFSAFAHYSVLQSEGESQGEQLRTLSKQLLGEEIDDFVRAKALVKGTGSDSDPTPRLDAFGVLDELSRRVPREMTHDLDDLDVRPDRVTMRGQVTSLTDVDSLYTALSEVECFPQIEKGRTTRTVDGSRQKYTFEITLRCPEPGDGEDAEGTGGNGPGKATSRRTTGTGGGDEEAE